MGFYEDVALEKGGGNRAVLIPGETVYVFTDAATQTTADNLTAPLQPLFSDELLTVPMVNPFTADLLGNLAFWADATWVWLKVGGHPARRVRISQVGPKGDTGAPGTAAAAASTYAGLPTPTAGEFRRVTDDIRGVWAANGTVWSKVGGHVLNVLDFGADRTGATYCDDAIEDALDAAAVLTGSTPVLNAGVTIYWPKGKYKLKRPVFSYTPSANRHGPMNHLGDGQFTTEILLAPESAADVWLYDSSPSGNMNAYQALHFYSMNFRGYGANAAFANGFRYYSTGHEKNFTWTDCGVATGDDGLGGEGKFKVWLYACGTGNADQTVHTRCYFNHVTDAILKVNNLQAVAHDFYGCQAIDFTGDLFRILDDTDDPTMGLGGGGQISWIGGTIAQQVSTEGKLRWIVAAAGSGNLSTMIRIRPDQFELDNAEGRLVEKTGPNGTLQVTFEQIKFDSISTDGADYTVVDIAQDATVIFRDCRLRSNMLFNVIQSSGGAGFSLAEPGAVIWENCTIPQDLSKRCLFGGAAYLSAVSQVGFFSATRCRCPSGTGDALNVTYGTYYHAVGEFDIGWQVASHGRGHRIKVASMHHDSHAWPMTGADEAGVVLPYNATIIGFVIYKPPVGADAGAHQYAVGPSDRSVTYASSTLAEWKDAHMINLDLPPDEWIFVGTDENKRKVELWASTAAGSGLQSPAGSVCLVKYL